MDSEDRLTFPLFYFSGTSKLGVKNVTYMEKVEQISPEDRELVRDELAWAAEWLRAHYPDMTVAEINRYLHEMVDVSL